MATQLLLRLYHITGEDDYRARAEKSCALTMM
jgi:hypothetical protein